MPYHENIFNTHQWARISVHLVHIDLQKLSCLYEGSSISKHIVNKKSITWILQHRMFLKKYEYLVYIDWVMLASAFKIMLDYSPCKLNEDSLNAIFSHRKIFFILIIHILNFKSELFSIKKNILIAKIVQVITGRNVRPTFNFIKASE